MIPISTPSLRDMTMVDLFAGLGGFRLALESLGARCVYSSEWDKSVAEVYRQNFGELPAGDITAVAEDTIPNHDILCAGFPCQAFSISGKQRGFADSRGTLFFDVARIVKAKKPKVVFLENVKHFASHDGGQTMAVVKATLEELGYTFFANILNASDYGIPQKRERIYMVAFRKDLAIPAFSFPKPIPLQHHVEDVLLQENTLVESLVVERSDITYRNKQDDTYQNAPIRLGTVNKGGQGERIYSAKGIAITLSAYGGGAFAKTGGYLIQGKPRRLHPRECARLMGYPDTYQLCKNSNQAYQQLGNSVVIDVLQYIAIEIGKALQSSPQTVLLEEDNGILRWAV